MERVPWIGLSVVAIGLALALPTLSFDAERVRLETLYSIHGVEVSRAAPTRLYLATHRGLFLASPDGTATKVSTASDNLMGFAVHPTSPQTFYASGHPPSGGNLGVVRSDDGGRSWSRLSEGANGPVDFHAIDVSKVNADIIYGTNAGLQVSRDGGKSWTR